MSDCGCSMRKPIENGLGSRWTPRDCSMAKVSRALWPSAKTTWSAAISSPVSAASAARPSLRAAVRIVTRPRSAPLSMRTSTRRAPKRTSPPSRSISWRMRSTTPTSRKVPMCGLATKRISSGAPARTNSSITLRVRWRGSLIWLHSLPSEKVPAPPSPNCTFDSGSRTPRRHRPQVSRVRSRTARPRSRTSGRSPIWARTSAAKMPHGPKPTTTGRGRPLVAKSAGRRATGR